MDELVPPLNKQSITCTIWEYLCLMVSVFGLKGTFGGVACLCVCVCLGPTFQRGPGAPRVVFAKARPHLSKLLVASCSPAKSLTFSGSMENPLVGKKLKS